MKRVLQAIGLLIAFIVITVVAVALAFDPNYYKPQIEKLAQDLTGRQVKIGGKVGWKLWPRFGITLPQVTMANAPGYPDEPMVTVALASVDVAVMPLFDRRAELGDVRVDGVLIRHQTRSGESNFTSLGSAAQPEPAATSKPVKPPKALLPSVSFSVDGISLTNLTIDLQDLDTGANKQLTIPAFTVGTIQAGKSSPVLLQARWLDGETNLELRGDGQLLLQPGFMQASIADLNLSAQLQRPQAIPVDLVLSTNVAVDLDLSQLELSALAVRANETSVSGELSLDWQALPKLRGKLHSPLVDVNAWLPVAGAAETLAALEVETDAEPAVVEPDLSLLNDLDAQFELRIDQIVFGKSRIDSLLTSLAVSKGVANLAPVAAKLYGGNLSGSMQLKDRGVGQPAAYELYAALRGIDLGELLVDLTDNNTLTGKGTFEFRGNGLGLVNSAWRSSVKGRGHLDVRDGAIQGFNVAQQIRDARARLRGEPVTEALKQTDFAALTGSFAIASGELINPDLQLMSPLLRINGNGHVQLVGETLDYRLGVSLVNSLKGQDGKSRDELAGVTIPLLIRGSWLQPTIELDVMAALQGRVAQEAQDKAESLLQPKLKRAEEKLKGMLDGQRQP
ncbi:MAG: AsmA family protein [Gammaproteobacteria bacterium]|nr:AsmA family protein [Gammaproteobacteria bacterium]